MYDIPIVEQIPGRIVLKYAKDAGGKPLVITYNPAKKEMSDAYNVAKQLEQAAITPWENNLGHALTLAEYRTGSVAHAAR